MMLFHVCSPDGLKSILTSGAYHPAYPSPKAGDSGLNCFIRGRRYVSQCIEGEGAELHLQWEGEFREVTRDEPFPLNPNVLYNQGDWRAIIPAGTAKCFIKVVGFDITDKDVRWCKTLLQLKRQLADAPIYLEMYHDWI